MKTETGVNEMDESTLYDRVGDATIGQIVDRFYERILADPDLERIFAYASMPRLVHMQRQVFAAALDGPMEYSGRDIHDVHAPVDIEPWQFSRFMEHLAETLTELEVDTEVVDRLMSRLALYADDVIGEVGEDG